MKANAPIILFVYNRPIHTQKTIDALLKNPEAKDSDLFVFADGPKSTATNEQMHRIDQVREYVQTIKGFKSVHIEQSDKNMGLANSVIYGVSKIVNQYGRAIVLEDDVITSSHFLHYMNQSLDLYKNNSEVWCINSACYIKEAPILEHTYLLYGADCQGWGTWSRAWSELNTDAHDLLLKLNSNRTARNYFTFNNTYPYMEMLQDQIDGKIDSWAIRWYASAVLKKGLCLYPTKSLVQNIGFDSEGTHTSNPNSYEASIMADETTDDFPKIKIEDSKVMRKEWERLFKKLYPKPQLSIVTMLKRKIKKILGIIR